MLEDNLSIIGRAVTIINPSEIELTDQVLYVAEVSYRMRPFGSSKIELTLSTRWPPQSPGDLIDEFTPEELRLV